MRDVACELAFTVSRDSLRRVAGIVEDFDLARLDDVELENAIANRDECLAIAAMSRRDGGAIGKLRDLVLIENRKGDGMECVFDVCYFRTALAAAPTSSSAR
jgi:hypothetical protein